MNNSLGVLEAGALHDGVGLVAAADRRRVENRVFVGVVGALKPGR